MPCLVQNTVVSAIAFLNCSTKAAFACTGVSPSSTPPGKGVVLAAMGFISNDDDIGAIAKFGIILALFGAEFLNQRKDIAVI